MITGYTSAIMKKLFLSLPLMFLWACGPATPTPPLNAGKTLFALQDFKFDAETGIYPEENRGAVAIDASNPEFRNVFFAARHTVDWLDTPQAFNLNLDIIAEFDGESEYIIKLNDKPALRATAPATPEGFSPATLKLGVIKLSPGDKLSVLSNAVTNGKIPEGDGTAYSRGRWTKVILKNTAEDDG